MFVGTPGTYAASPTGATHLFGRSDSFAAIRGATRGLEIVDGARADGDHNFHKMSGETPPLPATGHPTPIGS